jgi:diguanylate cyclase (GGDEF)-like protein
MQITFVYAFLTFLFIGVVSFFVWRANREEVSFFYWAISGVMQGTGWGLFVLTLANPSTVLVHSFAESLIFAGHVSAYLALANFTLRRVGRPQKNTLAVLIAVFAVFDVVCRLQNVPAWDGVVALSHTILGVLMMVMLFREARPGTYGIVYTVNTINLMIVAATLKKVYDVFFGEIATAEITVLANVNSAVVLSATMATVVGTVALSLLEFSRKAQRLNELAGRDPLTGTMNRRAWRTVIESECSRAKRRNAPFSVMMIDIDHFKKVNDLYGHPAGDGVLTSSARIIAMQLRAIDTLSRYGGEEFVVLLVDADEQAAARVAERIRASIAESMIDWEDVTFAVTCSIGVTEFDPETDTPNSLVARADKAMYRAKSLGRNRVVAGSAMDVEMTRPVAPA